MASVVEICNGALNQLGATTILSLTEDSKNARLCNQRFTQVRDAVFRSHPWNCLQKRQELAADTTAPAWGFKFAYTLPADCLRLLRILDYDSNYKVEGRKILSNESLFFQQTINTTLLEKLKIFLKCIFEFFFCFLFRFKKNHNSELHSSLTGLPFIHD